MPDYEDALWFINQFAQLWERNPPATCLALVVLVTQVPWLKVVQKAMFWKKSNTNIQEEVRDGVININDPKNVNFTQNIYSAIPLPREEANNGEQEST